MKVVLAGFNVDTEALKSLTGGVFPTPELTPEILSAAYARISRSSKPVHELRRIARKEVDKARRSNRRIIFEMGHHSVAEHAVFNFDILQVSRLAIEEIEKFRLCSFTEKSQRYVTLEDDFVVPRELAEPKHRALYEKTIRHQNALYHKLLKKLHARLLAQYAGDIGNPGVQKTLENLAKEDARYVTSMATESQLGLTINARNLERLFRRFASHELDEVRVLGKKMFKTVEKVAPSIILFVEENPYDRDTYPALRETARPWAGKMPGGTSEQNDAELVDCTVDADDITLSALLHTSTKKPFQACRAIVAGMNEKERLEFMKSAFRTMELYDVALREFEYVHTTFSLIVSASCFAQLKRHRMATITVQPYEPALGVTLPEAIRETGMEGEFREAIAQTEQAYETLCRECSPAAPYILTNAHRRRVLLGANARELYHISRLRQDPNAQWDIRRVATKMLEQAKRVMPLTLLLAGGKDRYPEIYEKVFGAPPRVTAVPPPGLPSDRQGL